MRLASVATLFYFLITPRTVPRGGDTSGDDGERIPEYDCKSIAMRGLCPDGYYWPLASSAPIECPTAIYGPLTRESVLRTSLKRTSVSDCDTCVKGLYLPGPPSSPHPCQGDTPYPEDAALAPSPSQHTCDESAIGLQTIIARIVALCMLVGALAEIAAIIMQIAALVRGAVSIVVALLRALAPTLRRASTSCFRVIVWMVVAGANVIATIIVQLAALVRGAVSSVVALLRALALILCRVLTRGFLGMIWMVVAGAKVIAAIVMQLAALVRGAVGIVVARLRALAPTLRRALTIGFRIIVQMVVASATVVLSVVTSVKVAIVSVYSGMRAVSPVVARGAQAVLVGVWADGKGALLMASTVVGLLIGLSVNAVVAILWATKVFHTIFYAEVKTTAPRNPFVTPGRRPPRCSLAPHNRGMVNNGNECWMLSAVQFITAMPKLRALLVAYFQQATQDGNQLGAFEHSWQANLTHRVLIALGKVLQELPAAKGARDIDLGELDEAWRGLFQWPDGSQQDATEALCGILNCLEEIYPSTKDTHGRTSSPHEALSFMTSVAKEFTKCLGCGRVSTTLSIERGVHCPLLQGSEAVTRQSQSSTSEVQFCFVMEYGAQQTYGSWKCDGCRQDEGKVFGYGHNVEGKLAMFSKKTKLTTAPSELVVFLRRHMYDTSSCVPKKICKMASFPLDDFRLPLYANSSTFDDEPICQVRYLCTAVVQHLGDSFASGHYISLTRETADPRSNWIEYDDSNVRVVPRSDVITEHAYMLVFRREDAVA